MKRAFGVAGLGLAMMLARGTEGEARADDVSVPTSPAPVTPSPEPTAPAPKPSPTPSPASTATTPERLTNLGEAAGQGVDVVGRLGASKGGAATIQGVKDGQNVLEKVGLKRGEPNAGLVGGAMFVMSSCFMVNYGNFNPAALMGPPCKYVLTPLAVVGLVVAPFLGGSREEMKGPSVHHLDMSVYALDYSKKSALTGQLNRTPSGSFLGGNLGYDLAYMVVHPRYGILFRGAGTLQQTTIAEASYVNVSNNFAKLDAQLGVDLIRLLSGGDKSSYWSQHLAYVRFGPSFFHDWIVSRDVASKFTERSFVKNPLNQSIGLVSALGYEIAAELDFRFPLFLGGLHLKFERGSYPSIKFPDLAARDGAFVALVGFDDLRAGSSYTWQRFKAELELPIDYSRYGGLFLGGQFLRYENNFGSGVDNRGISLDYRFRFQ